MVNRPPLPFTFPPPTTHSQRPRPRRLHPLARGAPDRAPPRFERHARRAAPRAGAPRSAVVGPDELGHLFEQGGGRGWCQGGGREARPRRAVRSREPARRRRRVAGAHCGGACVPAGRCEGERDTRAHTHATPAARAGGLCGRKNGQPTVFFLFGRPHTRAKATSPFFGPVPLPILPPLPPCTPMQAVRTCSRCVGGRGVRARGGDRLGAVSSARVSFRGLAFDTPLPSSLSPHTQAGRRGAKPPPGAASACAVPRRAR